MHSRTRVNDDDRSPAAEATHSELGVNTIARCRPVQFDGMAVNAKPVPGERLPDNFQLSGPHRPGDNFHLSVPLSNAFLERSTFHGRQQSWPKLQCLRAHFAKTTPTGRRFGQNSNSRCRCKFHFKKVHRRAKTPLLRSLVESIDPESPCIRDWCNLYEWAAFRHLQSLLTILKLKRFRASAEQLHTTQPNLSMHAKQFRECTFIRLYETAEIGRIE